MPRIHTTPSCSRQLDHFKPSVAVALGQHSQVRLATGDVPVFLLASGRRAPDGATRSCLALWGWAPTWRRLDASSPTSTPLARKPSRPRLAARSRPDRKSTRLNSSHDQISYAVFCLKKKQKHKYKFLCKKKQKKKKKKQ